MTAAGGVGDDVLSEVCVLLYPWTEEVNYEGATGYSCVQIIGHEGHGLNFKRGTLPLDRYLLHLQMDCSSA